MSRHNETKKIGILGIIGNIFLLVIKLIIGLSSSSKAMIADAFNSAGDIFASIMTFIGNKIASIPNDEDHNFGHGKAEYIFSMFISLSMILLSLKLVFDSILSIITHNIIKFSFSLLLVCMITIIVKLFLYLYTKKIYKNNNNLLLKSNMLDHRNDCYITIISMISIIFSKFGINYIDGIAGTIISLWIMYTGIKLFMESYNVLMDISIDNDTKKEVIKIIDEVKEIKKVDDIYYIPTGYKYVLVFTIFVSGNMKTSESHNIADKLENTIVKKINLIHKVIIHVNPI